MITAENPNTQIEQTSLAWELREKRIAGFDLMRFMLRNGRYGAHASTARQEHAIKQLEKELVPITKRLEEACKNKDDAAFQQADEDYVAATKNASPIPPWSAEDAAQISYADALSLIPPMFQQSCPPVVHELTFDEECHLSTLYKQIARHPASVYAVRSKNQPMADMLASMTMGATKQLLMKDLPNMRALREQFDLVLMAHDYDPKKDVWSRKKKK